METIKELEKFDGKRNTALTFIIPPNYDYTKDYCKIKKKHTAIKSGKRRGKLLCVTNKIDDELGAVKQFSDNGCIICCGLDKLGKPIFYKINSQVRINEFEYHYGYNFATHRINEILHPTSFVRLSPDDELIALKKLEAGLENGFTVVHTETQVAIDNNLLDQLYYFSSDNIPNTLLTQSIEKRFTIIMMNMNNVLNVDFAKKFGNIAGYMYFPVNLQLLI